MRALLADAVAMALAAWLWLWLLMLLLLLSNKARFWLRRDNGVGEAWGSLRARSL